MTSETPATALTSTAVVVTDRASRYLQQLCKHFGHRMPVDFTFEKRSISFDFGHCALAASGGLLMLTVTAGDQDSLMRLKNVIASHLERFAFRDKPEIAWH